LLQAIHIVLTSHNFFVIVTLVDLVFIRVESNSMKEKSTMLRYEKHGSEVARLLSQITAEYEAAQRGLTGLAFGTSQHEFITARMENMGQLHSELQTIVGDSAIALIADALNNVV
jgi:hypothetical protein